MLLYSINKTKISVVNSVAYGENEDLFQNSQIGCFSIKRSLQVVLSFCIFLY